MEAVSGANLVDDRPLVDTGTPLHEEILMMSLSGQGMPAARLEVAASSAPVAQASFWRAAIEIVGAFQTGNRPWFAFAALLVFAALFALSVVILGQSAAAIVGWLSKF